MRRVRRNGPWVIPEPLDGGRREKMKHHAGGNWVPPRHVKTPAGELDPEPPYKQGAQTLTDRGVSCWNLQRKGSVADKGM